MKTKRELTAPCGLDCFNCIVYEKNVTDKIRSKVAQALNIPEDEVPCKGCREVKGCRLHLTSCPTLDCITAKGLEFCFECTDFPCPKLMPVADKAGTYPHNMKLFNLCRMKKVGVEKWAEEESVEIRRKYFKGKFVPGMGPVLE